MAYMIQTIRGRDVDVPVILVGTLIIFFLVLFRLAGMSEALEKREQSSRLLFESSPLPMWVFDVADLHFLAVNDAAVDHYGYSRDEFFSMTIRDIRPDTDVPQLLDHLAGRDPATFNEGEWHHRTKAGVELEVDVVSHAINFEDREARLVVAIDVTERNRVAREKDVLEGQLQQAQKLEAVGQLAGGVAHDFNNLLAVIMNYVRFVKEGLDPTSTAHEDLTQVVEAGNKAAKLVRQLLAFSRREIVTPEILDLNEVVTDMEKILRRTIKESISLVFSPQGNLRHIEMDRGRLEQVLVNLAVNADAAMPDGGFLEITTSNQTVDEEAASQKAELHAGNYVRLSVSDNGFGMSQEVAGRIFEPFFTTKPVGQGTGLGLATVYGIVKQTGGYIYVYSEESRGTTFNLYLPATSAATEKRLDQAPVQLAGGSETILVVEDEPGVRRIAERILSSAGYQVMSTEDPLDAIELVRSDERHFDLLLTDVIMPNLSGKELALRLRRLRPGLRALFMSGYTDEIIAKQGILEPGVRFLQKPFGAEELLPAVREVLNSHSNGLTSHHPRILIVDDEEPMRNVLRLFLETNHFNVVGEAAGGETAIEMARVLDPDIIVLDYAMPGMDGAEAAPLLRVAAPRSRILAFSAALTCLPEWADGFLTKERIGEMLPELEKLSPS
jgi:PAS domain S-box-containing protein